MLLQRIGQTAYWHGGVRSLSLNPRAIYNPQAMRKQNICCLSLVS